MKYYHIAIITALLLIVGLTTGCSIDNPAYITATTPLDVNVVNDSTASNDVNITNNPLMVDAGKYPPYFVGVAEGDVPGHTPFYLIGYNPTVGTVDEDIWLGSSVYTFPAAPQQMRLFSSNPADNVTGTGIRTVRMYYLDGSYNAHTEDLTLQGTTFVNTTAKDILRVNGLRALTAGTNYKAVGLITLEGLTGQDYRLIGIGYTRDRSSIYTVPAGKSLYVTQTYAGVGGLNATNVCRLTVRANFIEDDGILTPGLMFQPYSEFILPNADIIPYFTIPLKFPSTVDIKFSAYTDSGSAFVEVAIRGWIE